MKRHYPKWVAVGVAGVLALGNLAPFTYADTYYQESNITKVAQGVTYQRMLRFTDNGWQNLNVARIDLKSKAIDIKALGSTNGISTKAKLMTMAQQVEDPVVAINADYFNWLGIDSPLGLMMNDGEMISSSVLEKPYSAFALSSNGEAVFNGLQCDVQVVGEDHQAVDIQAFNKISWKFHMMTVVDQYWGDRTPGVTEEYPDLVEIVVNKDTVVDVRLGKPSTVIPEEGYVVLASGTNGQMLMERFQKGDELQLEFNYSSALKDIKTAIGGGSMLIEKGSIVNFAEAINGNHPRTAIGINESGDELIMVTIDGRHLSYTGVNGQGMAEIMKELGAYHAMILDGGGSTTMAVRELGNQEIHVVNHPSDGSERSIINSLVVTSEKQTGKLEGLVFEQSDNKMMVGIAESLSIQGYDTAYFPLEIDLSEVRFKVIEGNGRIKKGELLPKSSGKLTVEASYHGKKVTQTFDVLSEPIAIAFDVERYHLKTGDSLTIAIVGVDEEGFRTEIPWQDVKLTDVRRMGSFKDGKYRAGEQEGVTELKASFKGLNATIPLGIGLRYFDMGSFEKYAVSFLGYPTSVKGTAAVSKGGLLNERGIRLTYDLRGTEGTAAAYALLGTHGITIPSGATGIALSIKSDQGIPHLIKAKIKDALGKVHLIHLTKGLEAGKWWEAEADIPAEVIYPAKLERIYVAETEESKKGKGTLWFDGLQFSKPLEVTPLKTEDAMIANDPFGMKPDSYSEKWLVYSGHNQVAFNTELSKNYTFGMLMDHPTGSVETLWGTSVYKTMGDFRYVMTMDDLILFLNDEEHGLRKSDAKQWTTLIRLLESNTKDNVYVFLSDLPWSVNGFSDKLEADLLLNKLEALNAAGKPVYVFYKGQTAKVELRNGIRFISTGQSDNEGLCLYKKESRTYYEFVELNE